MFIVNSGVDVALVAEKLAPSLDVLLSKAVLSHFLDQLVDADALVQGAA